MKNELKVWAIRDKKTKRIYFELFKNKPNAKEWIVGSEDLFEIVRVVIKEIKNNGQKNKSKNN